MKKKSPNVQMR